MGMDTAGGLSMQFVSSTQFDAHPGGGGNWVSCILPMQDITLRRFTDPHTSLGSLILTPLLAPSFTRCI